MEAAATATEPERVCRALGAIDKKGMLIQADPDRPVAPADYTEHRHAERNHQGKGNVILLPNPDQPRPRVRTQLHCRERLGGLLKYYCRVA